MSTVHVPTIDPTVDPEYDAATERLESPRAEYGSQLPKQVLALDEEIPDSSQYSSYIALYMLPPRAYVCTADQPRDECVGQVLRVLYKTESNWRTTTDGVCQNLAHREALFERLRRVADRTPLGAGYPGWDLYSTRFAPVHVEPKVDVDALSPLQRQIHDYLTGGEGTTHLRRRAFQDLRDNYDLFQVGRTDHNVLSLVDAYLERSGSIFCDEGKRQFRQDALVVPDRPAVVETELRPFHADRATTYTLEDLHGLNVQAEDRFVSVPALIEAVYEAKERHDLCDAGVADFFDVFGIDPLRTLRFGVDMRGPNGERHQALSFSVTARSFENLEDLGYSNGDLDIALTDAFREYLWGNLGISDDQLEIHKGFDTYSWTDD